MSIANTMRDEFANEPLNDKLDRWLDVLNYWFEHVEDYGDRYPDMLPMVKKFDQVINEIYETKELNK